MTLLKTTSFGVFGVMQCVCGLRFKKHIIVYIVAPLCPAFLKRTEMPCPGATTQKQHIIKEAFVASSGDIITDDLYCLFTCCIASRRISSRGVNITMSASVIGELTNNKLYTTPLKTHAWIIRICPYRLWVRSARLSLESRNWPTFIETAFEQASIVGYSSRFRKYRYI